MIFDAHEDLPKQILAKSYLTKPAKLILSKISALYESWFCPNFDATITVTAYIRDKFLQINANTLDIKNIPLLLNELTNTSEWAMLTLVVENGL